MKKIQYPPVYIGTFFLLIVAVIASVNNDVSLVLSIFNILFWPFIYGLGLAVGWHHRNEKSEVLQAIMYIIVALSFIIFIVLSSSAGLEKAFLYLLICIQAGRNFTLTDRRELYFACIISLILILYASSVSKETYFIFYIVFYVLAGMFTLMAAHIDERLSYAKGGDKDFLVNRINTPAKGIGLTAIILILSLFIYLILPRLPSPHIQAFPSGGDRYYSNKSWKREALTGNEQEDALDMEKEKEGGRLLYRRIPKRDTSSFEYAGFEEKFDVCECVKRTLSNKIVFYLHSDRPLYTRGKVFDTFDGRVWEDSGIGSTKLYSKTGKFIFEKDYRGKGTVQVYTIKRDLPPFIFSAYKPVILKFPGNVIEKGHAISLRAPENLKEGTIYSVLSEVVYVDGRISGGTEYHYILSGRYLQLPHDLSPEVRNLAVSITEGINDDFEKAKAVEHYLKNNYRYTLDTMFREWKNNPVEEFLFTLKQGHCELFASSMVVLLRTVNIPSRLVTGFTASRYNPITGYYEVRGTDGHAWVESYIENYGWVTFEPTPSFNLPEMTKRYFIVSSLTDYLKDRINALIKANPERWWAKIIDSFLAVIKKTYIFIEMILLTVKTIALNIFHWFQTIGWKFLILVLVSVGSIYVLYHLLRPLINKWGLKRLKESDSDNFIFECYRNMERLFAKKGSPRPLFYTPFEYKELLKIRFGLLLPQIEFITDVFQQAKYSPHPVSSEDADAAYKAYENIFKTTGSLKKSMKSD
jgi:transglutaminase-like putative cysteine protease